MRIESPTPTRLWTFLFLLILVVIFAVVPVVSFVAVVNDRSSNRLTIDDTARERRIESSSARTRSSHYLLLAQRQRTVEIEAKLDNDKVTSLFAWISRAFAEGDDYDPAYNNLMLACAAIFGNLPEDSIPVQMARKARQQFDASGSGDVDADSDDAKQHDPEEIPRGAPFSRRERESASLGAMGAGQWMGHYRTRPHALLDLKRQNLTSADDWVKSLPRGCRRTIKKARQQNFTVTSRPIRGDRPAPHSSLAHFRCVVAHEVRLLSWGADGFLEALATAVSRYVGTTQMAGEIQEYRNATGQVIALAHEVRKGRTIRGQWFYANDEASVSYVWFHSVYDLVRRALEDTDGAVDVVDLGPSGSDSFSELKAKYGFQSVDDWPAVADYTGGFWYPEGSEDAKGAESPFEQLLRRLL